MKSGCEVEDLPLIGENRDRVKSVRHVIGKLASMGRLRERATH